MSWGEIVGRIIAEIGGLGILVAGIVWLSRALLSQGLAKELESFKSQLQVQAERQGTAFSILQTRRAEVIAETYALIDRTYKAARVFATPLGISNGPTKDERFSRLAEVADQLRNCFDEQRIYFAESTCAHFDTFFSALSSAANRLAIEFKHGEGSGAKVWGETWKIVEEEVPIMKDRLEKDFRSLLGVKDHDGADSG